MTFTEDQVAASEDLGLATYRRYSIEEAANMLGVPHSVARKMISTGELGVIRVGKRAFVLGGHIAQYRTRSASGEGMPAE
jgi:excisionase family DNA binding protein